jgi:hypothetical protein
MSSKTLTLEQLGLDDLVTDQGKVRCVLNLFPVTVDGDRECRLFMVVVPGEEDDGNLAVVWYQNAKGGPVSVAGVQRVTERTKGSFVTADGVEHSYAKTSGCGCGNRLKNGWTPFDGYVRVVQVARQFQ